MRWPMPPRPASSRAATARCCCAREGDAGSVEPTVGRLPWVGHRDSRPGMGAGHGGPRMGPGTGVAHGGPRLVGPLDLLDEMADTAKPASSRAATARCCCAREGDAGSVEPTVGRLPWVGHRDSRPGMGAGHGGPRMGPGTGVAHGGPRLGPRMKKAGRVGVRLFRGALLGWLRPFRRCRSCAGGCSAWPAVRPPTASAARPAR